MADAIVGWDRRFTGSVCKFATTQSALGVGVMVGVLVAVGVLVDVGVDVGVDV